jgi:hypothetical protein
MCGSMVLQLLVARHTLMRVAAEVWRRRKGRETWEEVVKRRRANQRRNFMKS